MYYDAVSVLRQLQDQKGSIKSLVFGSHKKKNSKQIFALVCETLKYADIIDILIQKCKLRDEIKALKTDQWLARVLVYDLVFGKGLHGKFKVLMDKHKVSLQSELARLKIKAKVSTNQDLLTAHGFKKECVPRYVRVNSLHGDTTEEIIQQLSTHYLLVNTEKHNYNRFIDAVKNLKDDQFIQDIHIPNLLIFTSASDIHLHQLYKDGQIIFQDKASCLPAFVLSEIGVPIGSHVIDCCAAPGNKTSHMADILKNSGKVFAFDKDPGRIETMKKLLKQAGTTCVEVTHKDFLSVDPLDKKYSDVQFAIVDPSCSGSGIVNRLNQLTDSDDSCSKERLTKLSNFQVAILKHALSFPSMQYAVYSTCSVHEEENEQVLDKVLTEIGGKFELLEVLPEIPHRGLPSYTDICPLCVRLNPNKDCTNGFFVACFKRKNSNIKNIETKLSSENQKTVNNERTDTNDTKEKIHKNCNIETKSECQGNIETKSKCQGNIKTKSEYQDNIKTKSECQGNIKPKSECQGNIKTKSECQSKKTAATYGNEKVVVTTTIELDSSYNFKKIQKKIKMGKKRKITWDDDDNEEVMEEIMQSTDSKKSTNKETEVSDGNVKINISKKIKKSKAEKSRDKGIINKHITKAVNAENVNSGGNNSKKRKKKKKHNIPVTR